MLSGKQMPQGTEGRVESKTKKEKKNEEKKNIQVRRAEKRSMQM